MTNVFQQAVLRWAAIRARILEDWGVGLFQSIIDRWIQPCRMNVTRSRRDQLSAARSFQLMHAQMRLLWSVDKAGFGPPVTFTGEAQVSEPV